MYTRAGQSGTGNRINNPILAFEQHTNVELHAASSGGFVFFSPVYRRDRCQLGIKCVVLGRSRKKVWTQVTSPERPSILIIVVTTAISFQIYPGV